MPVHIKTIPNDFLMILQQRNGGHLAKSLCLCEIMQKRIPTDTRKSHFPTRGRRETGFVSKEKKFVSNPLRYIASSSQKNQVFTFCIHVFAFKLFFSCSAPYSAKKRLKGPQWYNWSNSIEVPPPSSTSAQTTSRTLEYDNRLSKN